MFIIIADEDFESVYGPVKKGDIIESCMHEDRDDFFRYLFSKYGPDGEPIRIRWKEIKEE